LAYKPIPEAGVNFVDIALNQPAVIQEWRFFMHLVGAALMATVLAVVYARYARSMSNRSAFGRTFILLATTTTLIITVVKSSLALSLGLVGALSIVRFRTAIKDPEELAYLFIAIGIGLGFGADQALITSIAFAVLIAIVFAQHRLRVRDTGQNMYLTLSSESRERIDLDEILTTLALRCETVELKRFDESGDRIEVVVMADFKSFTKLQEAREALRELDSSIRLTFMDNEALL
jgi:uncharacterized membrane protein YhiD involved in acid resistance